MADAKIVPAQHKGKEDILRELTNDAGLQRALDELGMNDTQRVRRVVRELIRDGLARYRGSDGKMVVTEHGRDWLRERGEER